MINSINGNLDYSLLNFNKSYQAGSTYDFLKENINKEADGDEDENSTLTAAQQSKLNNAQTLINKFAQQLNLDIGTSSTTSTSNSSTSSSTSTTSSSTTTNSTSTSTTSTDTTDDAAKKAEYENNKTVIAAKKYIQSILSDSSFSSKYNNFVAKYGGGTSNTSGSTDANATLTAARNLISQTLADSSFASKYASFVSKYGGDDTTSTSTSTSTETSTTSNTSTSGTTKTTDSSVTTDNTKNLLVAKKKV